MHFASKSCSPGTAMFSLPSLWVGEQLMAENTGAPSQRRIFKKVWNIFFFCVFEWTIYMHGEIADVILTRVHQQILIIIFCYWLPLKLKWPKHGI